MVWDRRRTLIHGTRVTPAFAALTVTVPVTAYIVVLALLRTREAATPQPSG